MDEPLKARLIGASILVLLAVALVPEMLSGPKNSVTGEAPTGGEKSTRTVTIDLGGAAAESARLGPRPDTTQAPATTASLPTVESPAPVAEVPTASTLAGPPAASQDAPPPPPPTPSPKVRPAAVEPATEPVAPAKGAFSVQVGAFGSEATARKLVNDLKADGMAAYIAPLTKAGKTLHRVRVGPAPDRAAADALASKLKARGLPVAVVPGG